MGRAIKTSDYRGGSDSQRIQRMIDEAIHSNEAITEIILDETSYRLDTGLVIEPIMLSNGQTKDVNLAITGQGYTTEITYTGFGSAIDIKTPFGITAEYPQRVRFVTLKNFTLQTDSQASPKGIGLNINSFGHIHLENLRVLYFDEGHHFEQGSEIYVRESIFEGNNIGGTFVAVIGTDGSIKEVANTGILFCSYSGNNKETCSLVDCRSVHFIGCSIMSYGLAFTVNCPNGFITMEKCDVENYVNKNPNAIYLISGTLIIRDCQLAFKTEGGIIVDNGGELILRDNKYNNSVQGQVVFDRGVGGKVISDINEQFMPYDETKMLDFNKNFTVFRDNCLNRRFFDRGTWKPYWTPNQDPSHFEFNPTYGSVTLYHPSTYFLCDNQVVKGAKMVIVEYYRGDNFTGLINGQWINFSNGTGHEYAFVCSLGVDKNGWERKLIMLRGNYEMTQFSIQGSMDNFQVKDVWFYGSHQYGTMS